ncbi:MAG: transglutaminase domain-containing protein [Chloroflexota bacterium]
MAALIVGSPSDRAASAADAAPAPAPATYDVAALALSLEYDPVRIFRFIADEIGYEPYEGALRGPQGTLLSRAGNSVDQALLLGALLEASILDYRYVTGRIDDLTAGRIMATTSLTVAQARDRAALMLLPPDVRASWGGQGPWTRAEQVDLLFSTARDWVDQSATTIDDALVQAGVRLATPDGTMPRLEQEQHVWVQVAYGVEWLDLDPALPGASEGAVLATGGSMSSTLPPELYHVVTVSVAADVIHGGGLTRTPLLSIDLRPAELGLAPVTFAHAPSEWLGIGASLAGQAAWVPLLLVGDTPTVGQPVSVGISGGVPGAFGQGGPSDGEAAAEYLVVDVTTPGGAARHIERTIFDRIPSDARAAGTIDVSSLPPVELVDAGPGVGRVFLPWVAATSLAIRAAPVPWDLFAPVGSMPSDEGSLMSWGAYGYLHLRDLLRLQALTDRLVPWAFDDEPSVVAFVAGAVAIRADGLHSVSTYVDVLHAHHRDSSLADLGPSAPAGILDGAIDHAAERLLLEGAFSLAHDDSVPTSFVSVGRVFEAAREQGISVRVLRPGDAVGLPPGLSGAAEDISDALARGLLIVVPASPVMVDGEARLGWWEVDPASGATRDRLDDGLRVEMEEDLFVEIHEFLHEAFLKTSCAVAVVGTVVALIWGSWNTSLLAATIAINQCAFVVAGRILHGRGTH